eukprot:scaffold97344_cov59-Cyclotella_meneghiniana.AAC.1
MENISIEVIGDAFADVYCYLESGLPSLGGDSRLTLPIHTVAGGSGLNTTTHLASLFRFFIDGNLSTKGIISLQTVINENDIYGKLIIDHSNAHNFKLINRRISDVPNCFVGTSEAKKIAAEKSTGHCAVIVANNDRSFMTHLGCMEDFQGSHILPSNISSECRYKHIHIAGYFNIPGFWDGKLATQLEMMRDNIKKSGIDLTVSLVPQHDATGTWNGGLRDVLKFVDFLILSEVEAKYIAGCSDQNDEDTCIEQITKIFLEWSPNTFVIMTRGSRGASILYQGNIIASQCAPRQITKPIDPTGAGDAFAAGFIYSLVETNRVRKTRSDKFRQDEIKQALKWGCAMGTCNVQVRGASQPCNKEDIKALFQDIICEEGNT